MIHRFSKSDGLISSTPVSNRSDIETIHPLLQVHDEDSPDLQTARDVARQTVNASGAEVLVHPRTNNSDVDNVFDEDADPTYLNPVRMKAFFAPVPTETELTQWGADIDNKMDIVFCLSEIYDQFKDRLLREGDIIEVPYNAIGERKPKYFHVNNVQHFGNYRYIWLYLKCSAELMVGEPNIKPLSPGY